MVLQDDNYKKGWNDALDMVSIYIKFKIRGIDVSAWIKEDVKEIVCISLGDIDFTVNNSKFKQLTTNTENNEEGD